jgi:hypothetical protein
MVVCDSLVTLRRGSSTAERPEHPSYSTAREIRCHAIDLAVPSINPHVLFRILHILVKIVVWRLDWHPRALTAPQIRLTRSFKT